MGKKLNKAAHYVSKAAGGADLVNYLGAKIAKARIKDKATRKLVEDRVSGKKALVSAARVAATVAPGLAVLKAARAGKIAKLARGESRVDKIYRRQDEEMWKAKGMKVKPGGRLEAMKRRK
jgi:hypothetical protein